MTSNGNLHPSLDLAVQLHRLAIRINAAVRDELHAAAIPGRSLEASVSGGSKSDPSGGRALAGAAPSDEEHPDPPPDPQSYGSIGDNQALKLAKPKLETAIDDALRVLAVLEPADPADDDGNPTGEKSCRVCSCCRAVQPRHQPVRCDSCYRHRQRHRGVDRTPQEVAEHQERMRAQERDRAEQRKAAG